MYVHGGSYTGGTKWLGKGLKAMANRALKRGIAFASLNYVLGPKGMRPQVWYDYVIARDSCGKMLRSFALTPTASAVRYFSGGWLISSAGHGTGDHFCNNRNEQMARLYDLANEKFKPYKRKRGRARQLLDEHAKRNASLSRNIWQMASHSI